MKNGLEVSLTPPRDGIMDRRIGIKLSLALALGTMSTTAAIAQAGVFEQILGHGGQPTLVDVARIIDRIQENILDQGTVVVKQPDVWSQARMTKFRQEFEDTMSPELTKFQTYLSARIARSDSAAFQSQTALGASISPLKPGVSTQLTSTDQVATERGNAVALLGTGSTLPLPFGNQPPQPNTPAVSTFSLLGAMTPASGATVDNAGRLTTTNMPFGLEPTITLDQKADYITHLHRLRRVNLGDDNADSAGYGLYLMRVPVSISPGERTVRGFGAEVNLTVRHDFGPRFLQSTYRNLVINDLMDQLAPLIHELIRNGSAQKFIASVAQLEYEKGRYQKSQGFEPRPFISLADERTFLTNEALRIERGDAKPYNPANRRADDLPLPEQPRVEPEAPRKDDGSSSTPGKPQALSYYNNKFDLVFGTLVNVLSGLPSSLAANRSGQRIYSIAPSDALRVFVPENLLDLAFGAQRSIGLALPPERLLTIDLQTGFGFLDTNKVRMIDVRSFLRHELESAYDLMEGRTRVEKPVLQDLEYIDFLTEQVFLRKFEGPKGVVPGSESEINEFATLYEGLTHRLPGNLHSRSIGSLCWGIAVQAGLLNRQLIEDMKQVKGADGYTPPPEAQAMHFFAPEPGPEVELVFQDYVKARWPMIVFALEPVVDQQNIEDAFTRRRDLQLAVAFALSSGRISFRQAINFTRQLQYEAQTIALNQTVSAYAHGNDNFGWRFSPRYQTPPEETNIRAIANMLWRGGPGPNYQLAKSKIEPGLRELTAVIVMPSFVRGVRIDVASNWYRLHDPDERRIHNARSIELGRRINEARDALDVACQHGKYRTDDVERLRVRLHQLEAMLPLQSAFVKMPYENTLGGFALFTQGATALVPQLSGFESGTDYIDVTKGMDLVIHGKNFNIYETSVVVGGKAIPREGVETVLGRDATGKLVSSVSTLTPLRDPDGSLLITKADGGILKVKDNGSYLILSREVMRLRIPPEVLTSTRKEPITGLEKAPVVEVYVSTPNGISNRLLIPLKIIPPPPTPPAPGPGAMIERNPAFTIVDTTLTVPVSAQLVNGVLNVAPIKPLPSNQVVRILPTNPVTETSPAAVRFLFSLADRTVVDEITVPNVTFANGVYALTSKQLSAVVKELQSRLAANGLAPQPASAFTTRRVTVQPKASESVLPTANQLTVNFEFLLSQAPVNSTDARAIASSSVTPGRLPVAGDAEEPAAKLVGFERVGTHDDGPSRFVRRVQIDGEEQPPPPPPADPVVDPTPPAPVPIPNPFTLLPAQTTQTMLVLPSSTPNINVSVTNVPRSHRLFNRNAPGRPPFLSRVFNGP